MKENQLEGFQNLRKLLRTKEKSRIFQKSLKTIGRTYCPEQKILVVNVISKCQENEKKMTMNVIIVIEHDDRL
jgi:hypothetical protein